MSDILKNEYGILILILYFDDYLLTGDTLVIESGINDIKKMFNATVTKNVNEYLVTYARDRCQQKRNITMSRVRGGGCWLLLVVDL